MPYWRWATVPMRSSARPAACSTTASPRWVPRGWPSGRRCASGDPYGGAAGGQQLFGLADGRRGVGRVAVGAYRVGVGINSIAPARGGDVVRLYLTKHRIKDSSYATLTPTLIVETLTDFFIGGAIIGGLARFILPGKQNISVPTTILAGIVAAFLGSLVARIFGFPQHAYTRQLLSAIPLPDVEPGWLDDPSPIVPSHQQGSAA